MDKTILWHPRLTYIWTVKELQSWVDQNGSSAFFDGQPWVIEYKKIVPGRYRVWFKEYKKTQETLYHGIFD